MSNTLSVLIAGQSSSRLNSLEDVFQEAGGIAITRKLTTDKQRDPLADSGNGVDVLVLDLGSQWEPTLDALTKSDSVSPVPLIVIGHEDQPGLMRKAMQAGARDFFVSPISEEELISSVRRIGMHLRQSRREGSGDITVIMNSKGGSGSSFLTAAFSTLLTGTAEHEDRSCVAVDLDLQFGNLPVYFDLPSNDHLADALRAAGTLDPVALNGLLLEHSSGVRVLASQTVESRPHGEFEPQDVHSLLTALTRVSDHVIVDIPRSFDPLSTEAIEMADRVVIVTQQTIPHVRNTKYLISLLRQLGVPNSRMVILVNRMEKKAELRMNDLMEAFPDMTVLSVINDYKRASISINSGVPVPMQWSRAPITKSMLRSANSIWVPESAKRQSGRRT